MAKIEVFYENGDSFFVEKEVLLENYRCHKELLNWEYISANHRLTEETMREFKDWIDWEVVCFQQEMSEDFIREFKERVDWDNISENQLLSEKFMEEFEDRINLMAAQENQDFSLTFAKKMGMYIEHIYNVNRNLTPKNKKAFENYFKIKRAFSQ